MLLIAAFESSAISQYAKECNYDEAGQKYCTSYHVALYVPWKLAEFFDIHNGTFSALFAAVVAGFTWRLWKSTDKLWIAGERQIGVAEKAAKSAEASNVLSRKIFVAEQRPWLLWHIPAITTIANDGKQLTISISGELSNIGKTPAFDVVYFGNHTGQNT